MRKGQRKGEIIDISNNRFGKLIAINVLERGKYGYIWRCICDCGKETSVYYMSLVSGNARSCGCLRKEWLNPNKHGLKQHPLYDIWSEMKGRCLNPKNKSFKNYGGRGITVCERWRNSFMDFYSDVIDKYQHGLQLDRTDNDGNYCPENFRFATKEVNENNKRNNVHFSYNGETKTLVEWANFLGVRPGALRNRRRKGWSDHDIISIPVGAKGTNGTHFIESLKDKI